MCFRSIFTIWLLVVLCGNVINLPAAGEGEQEAPIQDAAELIGRNENEQAFELFRHILADDPDSIEEIEVLLSSVRGRRQTFAAILERIVDTLQNDPDNFELIFDLVTQLDALDVYPNEDVRRRLSDTRQLARQAGDRRIVRQSIADVELLLVERRFLEALNIAGQVLTMNLQQESFLERGYDRVEIERNQAFASTIEGLLNRYRQFYTNFDITYDTLLQSIEDGAFDLLATYIEDYISDYNDILLVEVGLRDLAVQIAEQRRRLTGEILDESTDWFLVFYDVLVNGTNPEGPSNGLLGIVSRTRNDTQRRLVLGLLEAARRKQVSGFATYNANEYHFAVDNFIELEGISDIGVQASILGSELPADSATAGDTGIREFDRYRLLYDVWLSGAELMQNSAARLRDFDFSQPDEAGGLAAGLELIDPQLTTQQLETDQWRSYSQSVEDSSSELLLSTTQQMLDETDIALSTGLQSLLDTKLQFLEAYMTPFLNASRAELTRIEEELARGVQFYSGLPAVEGGSGLLFRYPSRASSQFAQLQDDVAELDTVVESFIQELRISVPAELEQAPVSIIFIAILRLDEQLDELRSRLSEESQIASGLEAEAAALVAEGDRLAAEVTALLAGLDIEGARRLWDEMRNTFRRALEIQEDSALRERSDELSVEIGLQVREVETELIVREVRTQITQAEQLFDAEDYSAARSQLDQAEEIWRRVNFEENQEITYLRRLVDAALTLEADRDLQESDPLYPVLSNYLNIAQDDFIMAQTQLSAGSSSNELIVRANENLDNVIAVRPYNWEARILELRLLQIDNTEDFDRVFGRRYQEILRRSASDPLDAWTSLEALAVIDPNFPGLQSNIEQLEITLGIRPPVVSVVDTQRVAALLAQANGLAQGGNDARVLAAISLLEEALALEPRNDEVRVLLDSLRINRGGSASIALSSSDQEQFLRAESLFVRDSVAQAFAIVERLWTRGQNQLYPPLISLRQRVTSRLGI